MPSIDNYYTKFFFCVILLFVFFNCYKILSTIIIRAQKYILRLKIFWSYKKQCFCCWLTFSLVNFFLFLSALVPQWTIKELILSFILSFNSLRCLFIAVNDLVSYYFLLDNGMIWFILRKYTFFVFIRRKTIITKIIFLTAVNLFFKLYPHPTWVFMFVNATSHDCRDSMTIFREILLILFLLSVIGRPSISFIE